MNNKTILNCVLVFTLLCGMGCSKSNTKEFFFGSNEGPDPFVIGTTLLPLKMLPANTVSNIDLPKPKPILTAAQMPSRAKKADDILGLITQNNTDIGKNKTEELTEATGTINQTSGKVIDFTQFDAQMNAEYDAQGETDYLLPSILGTNKSLDPTTREKIK